jgi:hypothetical protein
MPLESALELVKVMLGVFIKVFRDIDCDRKGETALYP